MEAEHRERAGAKNEEGGREGNHCARAAGRASSAFKSRDGRQKTDRGDGSLLK